MKSIVIIQTALAFFLGISSLILVYKLINRYISSKVSLESNNQSFGIFQAGLIISTALILSSVINPAINAIRIVSVGSFDLMLAMKSMAYVLIFFAIGVLFTLIIVGSGVFALFRMTSVDEWVELSNDNKAIAFISAAILIGLALIMDQYIGHLCEIIVPYPKVFQIN
ncbi:MAG: hypothetical protein ACON5K_05230 [Bacteroidia bacterium]|jgi:uncharacterized membrane protein YjfL (UPF0719 family)|nr:hypothetical protein [Bacteroidia bacterium]